MKLAFAAPASGLPFLSTAFGSQASFVHFVMKLLSAAPARGLPSFPDLEEEGDPMLVNHTHERLVALGHAGEPKGDDQQRQPDVTALTFEQRIGLMIDREATERENKRLAVRLKFAALRQTAIVEDVDLRTPRGIDRAFFAKLVDGDWISRKQNLLITGPTRL